MGCKNIYSHYRISRLRRSITSVRSNSNQVSNSITVNDPPIYNMLDNESYSNTNPVIDYETSKNHSKPSDLPTYDQVVISLKTKSAKFVPSSD